MRHYHRKKNLHPHLQPEALPLPPVQTLSLFLTFLTQTSAQILLIHPPLLPVHFLLRLLPFASLPVLLYLFSLLYPFPLLHLYSLQCLSVSLFFPLLEYLKVSPLYSQSQASIHSYFSPLYHPNNVTVLVHRKLSNRHIDLSDFSSAALSSIAVATATPHSSALHMRKSSCVNIADT